MEMDDSQVNMMLLFIFVVTKTDSSLISLMWKNRKNRKKKTNKKNNCILQCDFFCIIDLRWTSGTHYFFLGVSKASPKRSSLQFFTQYLHTNITYRIKTLGYFFSSSFSENSCCLLAGEAHGLSFSVLSSVLCLFSFCHASSSSLSSFFSFSCHFAFAPWAWNQSQWEPGVYGSQQGWGDQTLFEYHMWRWLNGG